MSMSDKIIDKIMDKFEEVLNNTSMEEKLDYALEARSIKVCKNFGLTAEEAAKKLNLNLTRVKIIYSFDDKGLIDWSTDI